MANTVKEQIAKSTEAVQAQLAKSSDLLRKNFRAYVGLHTAAYERLVPVVKSASKNYDELAEKGEAFENAAQSFAKDARVRVEKSYKQTVGKVRSVLPVAANDRVEELEAEIARLNKKITTFAKKAPKKVVKRTVKPAAKAAEVTKTVEATKAA
jgi:polyhydroxyalkanoate synthesis regulator phasin